MPAAKGTTVPRYTTLVGPVVSAYLWNPPIDRIEVSYPYNNDVHIEALEPALVITGDGHADGNATLHYVLEASGRSLERGQTNVCIHDGWFEIRITPAVKHWDATHLRWSMHSDAGAASASAPLLWSRFRGVVRYRDGVWRSTHIDMRPIGWGGIATNFTVPVYDDGTFDALVPARVYAILNVNGTGYGYNSLERWAWDYDLTVDRQDEFTIGRTELYGMRAFHTKGGPNTLFVIFRPTALSRLLQYDEDGDGFVRGGDCQKQLVAMRRSPTAIGPELMPEDIAVWYDGERREIVRLDQIPEYCGDDWQVQYLLQFAVDKKPPRGVWKEIRVEVQSAEELHGQKMIDFGQGSVGICLP